MDVMESTRLVAAIQELHHAARFNETQGTVNLQGENLGAITNALMAIEQPKVATFVRLARTDLEENPRCKVGIFVNYKISLNGIAKELAAYKPLILQGSVPKKKRADIIAKFSSFQYRAQITD